MKLGNTVSLQRAPDDIGLSWAGDFSVKCGTTTAWAGYIACAVHDHSLHTVHTHSESVMLGFMGPGYISACSDCSN